MSQVAREILRTRGSGRFSVLAALLGLGLLFAASSANAGCAVPNNLATPHAIPFVSPQGDAAGNHQEGDEGNRHADIVGLWHLTYTANSASPAGAFPPTPFQFLESFKTWHADGTEFENAFLAADGRKHLLWSLEGVTPR